MFFQMDFKYEKNIFTSDKINEKFLHTLLSRFYKLLSPAPPKSVKYTIL